MWIDEGHYPIDSCQSIIIESNVGHIEASEGECKQSAIFFLETAI